MAVTVVDNYVKCNQGAVVNNIQVPVTGYLKLSLSTGYYIKLKWTLQIRAGNFGSLDSSSIVTGTYNFGYKISTAILNFTLSCTCNYYDGWGTAQIIYTYEAYTDSSYTNKVWEFTQSNHYYLKSSQNIFGIHDNPSILKLWEITQWACTTGEVTSAPGDFYLYKYGRLWKSYSMSLKYRAFWPSSTPSYGTSGPFSFNEVNNWEYWKSGKYGKYYGGGYYVWDMWASLTYSTGSVYKTYPGLWLENTLSPDVAVDDTLYVINQDLELNASISGVTIQAYKDNFGNDNNYAGSAISYPVDISALGIGIYNFSAGVIGSYYNSSLNATVIEDSIEYNTENKYLISGKAFELTYLKILHTDLSETDLYNWDLSYENGNIYLSPTTILSSGEFLKVGYKEYDNIVPFEIVLTRTPLIYYAEDSASIAANGPRKIYNIVAPVSTIEAAADLAERVLEKYATQKTEKSYGVLQISSSLNIGDTLNGEKIIENKIILDYGKETLQTVKTGDVSDTLLDLLQ